MNENLSKELKGHQRYGNLDEMSKTTITHSVMYIERS